jgi:hypothetical protein
VGIETRNQAGRFKHGKLKLNYGTGAYQNISPDRDKWKNPKSGQFNNVYH